MQAYRDCRRTASADFHDRSRRLSGQRGDQQSKRRRQDKQRQRRGSDCADACLDEAHRRGDRRCAALSRSGPCIAGLAK